MQKYVEKAAMIAMTVNSVTGKTESESSALEKDCLFFDNGSRSLICNSLYYIFPHWISLTLQAATPTMLQ
jgi:hypothetical protein